MNHTKEEIIKAINDSGKLEEIESIAVSEDRLQQGILGNIKKIKLKYIEQQSGMNSVMYKQQGCSNKVREAKVYDLLEECCKDLIPKKIWNFPNGDLIIEDLNIYTSGKIIEGCSIVDAKKVLSGISKVHSFFWDKGNIPIDSEAQFADIMKYNLHEDWESYLSRYFELLGDSKRDFIWLMSHTDISSKILHGGQTLSHGDLHLENIMFSESEGIRFIDWQLASRRCLAFDISFFIIQNIDSETRKYKEIELLEFYYNNLSTKIKEVYSFATFHLEYRACLTRSMMSSVMMIGKRFSHKEKYLEDADIIARRVINAIKDLNPIEAIEELNRNTE